MRLLTRCWLGKVLIALRSLQHLRLYNLHCKREWFIDFKGLKLFRKETQTINLYHFRETRAFLETFLQRLEVCSYFVNSKHHVNELTLSWHQRVCSDWPLLFYLHLWSAAIDPSCLLNEQGTPFILQPLSWDIDQSSGVMRDGLSGRFDCRDTEESD